MGTAVRFYEQQPMASTADTMREDIIRGLRAPQKTISPKYLYDQRGSELFEKICQLPEYYPTRTEEGILAAAVHEIAQLTGENATLVELGSGASRKVRLLLESMQVSRYLGIDISRDFLLESTRKLAADYPWLEVHAACADFCQRISLPPGLKQERVVGFFPGSSIGNFEPSSAERFLGDLRSALPDGSGLLIGVDLVKDTATLEAAYDDAAGVTAEFNLNLLNRLARELDANLEARHFTHKAWFNAEFSRIEMHLVSNRAQVLHIAGEAFQFQAGETLHTENSYKYTVEGFLSMARRAGFTSRGVWTDSRQYFSVHYLECEAAPSVPSS